MKQNRARPIDASRGAAMLFVFIAHFGAAYFQEDVRHVETLGLAMSYVGMIASPMFMVVSGLTLGFLYRTKGEDFARIKNKLIDRGLFLLTVGRLLIGVGYIVRLGSIQEVLKWGFITDAIGFSIIVGATLIGRTNPKQRVILSLSVYVLSWFMVLFWYPENFLLVVLKETFFGSFQQQAYVYNFPLLPWFSLYLASTCIGQRVGAYYLEGRETELPRLLGRIASFSVAVAVVIKVIFKLCKGVFNLQVSPYNMALFHLTSPFYKLPPSPAYFMLYGGIALMIAHLVFKLDKRAALSRVIGGSATLGQSSLFIFILQYYVYDIAFYTLKLPFSLLWPSYFALSVVFMCLLSSPWAKRDCSRFFTVGYTHINSWRVLKRTISSHGVR